MSKNKKEIEKIYNKKVKKKEAPSKKKKEKSEEGGVRGYRTLHHSIRHSSFVKP